MITDDRAKRNIAVNVRRLLKIAAFTQRDLAVAVGESEMAVSYLIRGERMPGAAFLARVAEALGVSADYLMSDPPEHVPVA